LVVDDEPRNVKLLEAILRPLNYEVIKAFNGEDALTIINKIDVDLVLLDVMMPLMDGYEVCRRLKASEATRLIPVVMVTALDSVEDKINGIEAGADDFITKPPNKMELLARTKSLINLKKLNDNLTSIEQVLFSLANTVDAKDTYTQGHVERVSDMAMTLGHRLALSASELQALRYGGALHDIGKIGVPDEIINKQGPLDPEEWNIMKSHPDLGFKICMPLRRNLKTALDVIRNHHEKLDGSGYPDGLKGEQISTVVRIMAVVDIFDALTTGRSYRKAMPRGKALEILRNEAEEGKLDQEIVRNLEILVSSNKFAH
jgi:putative two-component system response regulator